MVPAGSSSQAPHEDGQAPGRETVASFATRVEQWVEEYGNYLFRYAWARVHDRHAAEDLVQQSLLAAWKSQERFAEKASAKTWLTSILRHKIMDYIRKKNREYPVDCEGQYEQQPDASFNENGFWDVQMGKEPRDWRLNPGEALYSKEFMQILERCLEDLPEQMRVGFVMRELEGLSPQEIRDLLEVSRSNVWVLLHRARKQLRGCIEKHWLHEAGKH